MKVTRKVHHELAANRRQRAAAKAVGAKKTTTAKKTTKAAPKRTPKAKARDPRLPAVGSKLTRSYHGEEHVVEVVEGGFKHQGETFTSLTALAKKITGYQAISGPAFFGLWKRAEAK